LTVTVDGAVITIVTGGTTHKMLSVEGTYPDTAHITRKALAAPEEMAQFNPALMERLHACIVTASGADKAIPSYSQRGTNPCIVTASALPEFVGLVLPWRADEISIPEWIRQS